MSEQIRTDVAAVPRRVRRPRADARAQRGFVSLVAVIVMAGMALTGIALIRTVDTGNVVAGNVAFRRSASHAGDRGIETALGRLQKLLNAKATDTDSGNYFATYDPAVEAAPPASGEIAEPETGNTIRYVIERLCAAGTCLGAPSTYYRVTVEVKGPRGARGRLQAVAREIVTTWSPPAAVTTGGNLTISGNATITGTAGGLGAHSNSDVLVSGNPNVDGTVSAAGTATDTGGNTTLTLKDKDDGVTAKAIAAVRPGDFKTYAEYVLKADGNVVDNATGAVLVDVSAGGDWNGWQYGKTGDTVKWSLAGNTTIDGRLYVEGDAVVSGSPGSKTTPWRASLFADGNIEISGNPIMKAYDGAKVGATEVPEGVKSILLMAGLDLKINGNLKQEQSFQGIMAAREQVQINGNPSLGGYVIAEDAGNASDTVTENTVSGNMDLASGGELASPWTAPKPERLAWRELK